jgi:hypothetical protein
MTIYSKGTKGNRFPDFSYVGYDTGERAIPHVPVRTPLEPGQSEVIERILRPCGL